MGIQLAPGFALLNSFIIPVTDGHIISGVVDALQALPVGVLYQGLKVVFLAVSDFLVLEADRDWVVERLREEVAGDAIVALPHILQEQALVKLFAIKCLSSAVYWKTLILHNHHSSGEDFGDEELVVVLASSTHTCIRLVVG